MEHLGLYAGSHTLKVLDVYSEMVGTGCRVVWGGGHWACFTKAALLAATELGLNGQRVPAAYI